MTASLVTVSLERGSGGASVPGLDPLNGVLGRHRSAVGKEIVGELVQARVRLHNDQLRLMRLGGHADKRHDGGACQNLCDVWELGPADRIREGWGSRLNAERHAPQGCACVRRAIASAGTVCALRCFRVI